MTKYIAYCRRTKERPELKKELSLLIKNKLKELMKPKSESEAKFSFRHLEGILRFAYASARLHLRDVTEEDILLAFQLKKKSFEDLGIIDKETGLFNYGKIENIDYKKVEDRKKLEEIFDSMMPNGELVLIDDLITEANKNGIPEKEVYEYIEKGRRNGDWFEPNPDVNLRRI